MRTNQQIEHVHVCRGSSQELLPMIGRWFVWPIRIYQIFIAPLLGPRCRFYPSCSRYAVSCLEEYPFPHALRKITCRLLRCHPWHPGGVDLP